MKGCARKTEKNRYPRLSNMTENARGWVMDLNDERLYITANSYIVYEIEFSTADKHCKHWKNSTAWLEEVQFPTEDKASRKFRNLPYPRKLSILNNND